MVTNIIFDIGNVLVSFQWADLAEEIGFTKENVRVMNERVIGDRWNELDRGVMSEKASFVFSDYANAFIKENKGRLDSLYKSTEDFDSRTFDTMFTNYLNRVYGEMQHLRNEEHAVDFIKEYLRFEIARGLYGYGEAYRVFLESDDTFQQAVEIMHNKKIFKKYKVDSGR